MERDHIAQFFDDDLEFERRVGDFIAEGVKADDAILILATSEHARAIERRLSERGCDVDSLQRAGRYVVIDADAALREIAPAGAPNSVLFGEVVGGALRRLCAVRPRVRVFGELVSLLWTRGRRDDAIEVEQLWNELMGFHPISLLCGYQFDGAIDAPGFERISAAHARLDPPPVRSVA